MSFSKSGVSSLLEGRTTCLTSPPGAYGPLLSARIDLYNCHDTSTHIIGATGGNTDDLKESIRLAAEGRLRPAVTVPHVGGVDSIVEATSNLPKIPDGKKLTYPQFEQVCKTCQIGWGPFSFSHYRDGIDKQKEMGYLL